MLVQGISEKSQKIQNIMHNYNSSPFSGLSEFMHILCFPENELIAPILLWDGCYWFTKYGK